MDAGIIQELSFFSPMKIIADTLEDPSVGSPKCRNAFEYALQALQDNNTWPAVSEYSFLDTIPVYVRLIIRM